jgi:hypothetical protein
MHFTVVLFAHGIEHPSSFQPYTSESAAVCRRAPPLALIRGRRIEIRQIGSNLPRVNTGQPKSCRLVLQESPCVS